MQIIFHIDQRWENSYYKDGILFGGIYDDAILVTIPFNRINKVGDKVGDKVGNKVGNKNLNISQIKVLAEITLILQKQN